MKKVLISLRIDENVLSRVNDIAQRASYRNTSSVINTIIEATLYDDGVSEKIPFNELERRYDFLVPIERYSQFKYQEMWKPSKKQMDALTNAIFIARRSGNKSANDLITLHDQLSKF